MGFYRKYIFPRIVEWTLGQREITELRAELLKGVEGKVLEIGFGTGLNLPHYPPGIRQLSIVDPNPGMHALAVRKMMHSPIKIDGHVLKGENLPFPGETYDAVVTTFTLCSIPEVGRALIEVARVLKPGGKFYFLEHGLSEEFAVQRWQNRLTPIQKKIADGCHLNRKIDWLIEAAGLKIVSLKKFYFEKAPKFLGYLYMGIAER